MSADWDEPMPPLPPWWQILLGGAAVAAGTFALLWLGMLLAIVFEGP